MHVPSSGQLLWVPSQDGRVGEGRMWKLQDLSRLELGNHGALWLRSIGPSKTRPVQILWVEKSVPAPLHQQSRKNLGAVCISPIAILKIHLLDEYLLSVGRCAGYMVFALSGGGVGGMHPGLTHSERHVHSRCSGNTREGGTGLARLRPPAMPRPPPAGTRMGFIVIAPGTMCHQAEENHADATPMQAGELSSETPRCHGATV